MNIVEKKKPAFEIKIGGLYRHKKGAYYICIENNDIWLKMIGLTDYSAENFDLSYAENNFVLVENFKVKASSNSSTFENLSNGDAFVFNDNIGYIMIKIAEKAAWNTKARTIVNFLDNRRHVKKMLDPTLEIEE